MKLFVLITLLGAVTFSAGQKPCCFPKQIMAGNGAVVGQVDPSAGIEGLYVYQYGAFDYTQRQFGYNMTVAYPNGTSNTFRVIQHYAADSAWVIYDAQQFCAKLPATKPEPISCIPDNATLTDRMLIGGPKGLKVDDWAYTYVYPKDPLEGVLSISVVQGNCYPVGSNFLGNRYDGSQRVPMLSSGGILNMTLGIPDPDVWLKVPSFCNQDSNTFSRHRRASLDLDFLFYPGFF